MKAWIAPCANPTTATLNGSDISAPNSQCTESGDGVLIPISFHGLKALPLGKTGMSTPSPVTMRNARRYQTQFPYRRRRRRTRGARPARPERPDQPGVIGFHGVPGHINSFAKIPNVRVAALCDVDERLFPDAVALVEKLGGNRPHEVDVRRLVERKDIDAVSIATPDYWHALMTIWACQAGKDVYVEKPVSFTFVEAGAWWKRRAIQRIVQAA